MSNNGKPPQNPGKPDHPQHPQHPEHPQHPDVPGGPPSETPGNGPPLPNTPPPHRPVG